jgi:hypothetical protein
MLLVACQAPKMHLRFDARLDGTSYPVLAAPVALSGTVNLTP